MELFFTNNIAGSSAVLDKEESRHCVKVLRHKVGDSISFIDGKGGFYKGEISEISGDECKIRIVENIQDFAPREYYLHMAVAPTKNPERYEWFMEKAAELGLDEITPVIADHSERRIFKTERGERILLSATKQSVKAKVPVLNQMTTFRDFIIKTDSFEGVRLIAHCNAGERTNIVEALNSDRFLILIGPEGDFSASEVELAVSHGFIPVTLGESVLRVETAALMVVTAVYLLNNR